MAKVLHITKRGARVFSKNIGGADQQKDIKKLMRFRRLSRKFKACCEPYWSTADNLIEDVEVAKRELDVNSAEFASKIREINKAIHSLDHSQGIEPAHDEHTDGILLETDEFNFLSENFNKLQGIPDAGEAGDIWEEIYEAFKSVEDVKVKPVRDDVTAVVENIVKAV